MKAKEKNARTTDKVRFVFLQSGLIVALSIMLLAFEWGKSDVDILDVSGGEIIEVFNDTIIQTVQKEEPIELKEMSQKMIIVDTQVDPDDEFKLLDPELNIDTKLAAYVPPKDDEPEDPGIIDIGFIKIEDQPSFPGGEIERLRFLSQNVKYPEMARSNGIQGKVIIGFIVAKDGTITDVKVLKDIGGGCGTEAARVVKMMPKWNPGKQRNKPVYVKMTMPIDFRLQSQ